MTPETQAKLDAIRAAFNDQIADMKTSALDSILRAAVAGVLVGLVAGFIACLTFVK